MSNTVASVALSRPNEMARLAHEDQQTSATHAFDGLSPLPMNGHLIDSPNLQAYNSDAAFNSTPDMQAMSGNQGVEPQQGFGDTMSPYPVDQRMDTSNYNFYQYGNAFPDDVQNGMDGGSGWNASI